MIIFSDTSSFLDGGACCCLFLSEKGSRIRRFLCHRYTIVAVVVRGCGGCGGGGGGSCNCPAPDEERVGYGYCGESAFVVIKAT